MIHLCSADRYIVFNGILEHGDVPLGETDTVPKERKKKMK